MAFTIDKDVPLPVRSGVSDYPFEDMEVGDSFAVPEDWRRTARNAANLFKVKNPGWDYRTAKIPEGLRIWRIS